MARPVSALSAIALSVAIAAPIAEADPTVTYVGAPKDNFQSNPREDGDRELAVGNFEKALELYQIAINNDARDPRALREGGRAAHALQKFAEAADYLGRASALATAPDPELHYLLGEALWALHKDDAARTAHQRALTEIGDKPEARIQKLWVARIHGRLGDRAAADSIYDALTQADPRDAEAALAQAEMHAVAAEWPVAERVVRRLLANLPDHARASEVLAWVLEARGQLGSELELRKSLAKDSSRIDVLRDYGRVLERSGDWAGALAAYRRAAALPDGERDTELSRALARVDQRMSTELGGGFMARTDPAASGYGVFAGVAAPFGRASHWTINARHEQVSSSGKDILATDLRAAASLRAREAVAILGFTVALTDRGDEMANLRDMFAPGAFGSVSSGLLAGHFTLALDAELGTPWRETPRALVEAGRVDSVTPHVYFSALSQRLVIDTGVQARRLSLAADGTGTPHAGQLLAWGGADFLAWSNFKSEARGQILDDDLLRSTYSADSAVIGYRHYELFGDTDQMFAQRLSLADRGRIDEISFTLRKVVARGVLALEARGGAGRDWIRELYVTRGGIAAWISPSSRSRVSLTLDISRESVRTLSGERRTGWVNYHVDL